MNCGNSLPVRAMYAIFQSVSTFLKTDSHSKTPSDHLRVTLSLSERRTYWSKLVLYSTGRILHFPVLFQWESIAQDCDQIELIHLEISSNLHPHWSVPEVLQIWTLQVGGIQPVLWLFTNTNDKNETLNLQFSESCIGALNFNGIWWKETNSPSSFTIPQSGPPSGIEIKPVKPNVLLMRLESVLQHLEISHTCLQNVHQLSHSFLLRLQNLKNWYVNTRIGETSNIQRRIQLTNFSSSRLASAIAPLINRTSSARAK